MNPERLGVQGWRERAFYPPSWLSRLAWAVERIRGSYWLIYGGLWLIVFAALTSLSWLDGSYPVGTLHPRHADFTFWGIYILALSHHLAIFAGRVFERARPLLQGGGDEHDRLRYQLTTPPAGWTLAASIAAVAWGAVAFMRDPAYIEVHLLYGSPAATILELVLLTAYSFISGAAVVHIVHQLAAVRRIYARCEIDLFAPQGLYGFAALTSRTAVAILLLNYLFLFTGSNLLGSGIILGSTVFFSSLAIFLFLWPLWGAHQLLVEAKEQQVADLNRRITSTIDKLERAVDAQDLDVMDPLSKSLTALQTARTLIERASTWPWNPETPRLLATAIVVPIGLYLLQRLLEALLF